MSIYISGEVLSVERKQGRSTAGNEYDMTIVSLLLRGKKTTVQEVTLADDLLRDEGRPAEGDHVVYEVTASARTFRGVASVSWNAIDRAHELEPVLVHGVASI